MSTQKHWIERLVAAHTVPGIRDALSGIHDTTTIELTLNSARYHHLVVANFGRIYMQIFKLTNRDGVADRREFSKCTAIVNGLFMKWKRMEPNYTRNFTLESFNYEMLLKAEEKLRMKQQALSVKHPPALSVSVKAHIADHALPEAAVRARKQTQDASLRGARSATKQSPSTAGFFKRTINENDEPTTHHNRIHRHSTNIRRR